MLDPYRAHLLRLSFLFTVAASVVILFTPASGVPSAPPGTDKVIHLLLFTALALTGRAAAIATTPLLVGLVCYAAVSEVLQGVLPLGRTGSPLDAAFDLLGVAAGWSIAHVWQRRAAR